MSILVKFPVSEFDRAAFVGFRPTAEFDIATARALMWVSQLAYQTDDLPTLASVVSIDWSFRTIHPMVEGGPTALTSGLWGERDDAIVFAVAGTDPGIPRTLLTDGLIRLKDGIHEGFGRAFDLVKSHLVEAIEMARSMGKPLVLAGHSLGGALAVLAAEYSARVAGHAPEVVYTFGCPRVGDANFAGSFRDLGLSSVTYRLVHGADLVPRVPPTGLSYVHVGRLLHCGSWSRFADAGPPSVAECDEPDIALADVPGLLLEFAPSLDLLVNGPPSRMAGELGKWYALLAPPIREHLQDGYMAALR